MLNYIVFLCWMYIVGIVGGLLFYQSGDIITYTFIAAAISLIISIILISIKKLKPLIFVLIAISGILFGFSMYNSRVGDTENKLHIEKFAGNDFQTTEDIQILAEVIDDPEVLQNKKRFVIKPIKVKTNDGKVFNIEDGLILAQIRPWIGKVYHTIRLGDIIRLKTKLILPNTQSIPNGFDYRRHLRDTKGVYAVCYPSNKKSIQIIDNKPPDPLTRISMYIKKGILRTFKKTIPFPSSAFLGGVTLGIRTGLDGVKIKPEYDMEITDEFRWSGTSHVLAVSGLHVSIITVMFVGLFSIFKVNKKVYTPIIILLLIIFTIITGSRPSTQRAAIMNSLVLLTYSYLGAGFRSSLLTGVAVAAVIILIINPLTIVSPSFTLSFGAILSLGLLTTPISFYLGKMSGWTFKTFLLLVIILTFFSLQTYAAIATTKVFIISMLGGFIILFIIAHYLNKIKPVNLIVFEKIPGWLGGFISAQFAIQLGMMIPLSMFYFGRYPIAGPYANFIAIPLIGIIVQLGIIAGILGALPAIGIKIALLVNATNWLLCNVFLYVAHFSTKIFTYPVVPKPALWMLFLYYGIILLFAFSQTIIKYIQKFLWEYFPDETKHKYIISAGILIFILIIGSIIYGFKTKPDDTLRITVLDIGYGNATIIETPSKKCFLIDGGYNTPDIPEKRIKGWNTGLKNVLPYIQSNQYLSIECAVLSNIDPEYITGLTSILKHYSVKRVIDPLGRYGFTSETKYDDWLHKIDSDYLTENQGARWLIEKYKYYRKFLKVCEEYNIPRITPKKDYIIHEETVNYQGKTKKLKFYVLSPFKRVIIDKFDKLGANSVVTKIDYGNIGFLFTSGIGYKTENILLKYNRDSLNATVMQIPQHARKFGFSERFLKYVNPKYLFVGYSDRGLKSLYGRAAKKKGKEIEKTISKYSTFAKELFRTDKHHSIIFTTDGNKLKVDTMYWRRKRLVAKRTGKEVKDAKISEWSTDKAEYVDYGGY